MQIGASRPQIFNCALNRSPWSLVSTDPGGHDPTLLAEFNALILKTDKQLAKEMTGAKRELWLALYEKAANDQDPKKLLILVEEINGLLEEREANG
jgi:hypothetical protein